MKWLPDQTTDSQNIVVESICIPLSYAIYMRHILQVFHISTVYIPVQVHCYNDVWIDPSHKSQNESDRDIPQCIIL